MSIMLYRTGIGDAASNSLAIHWDLVESNVIEFSVYRLTLMNDERYITGPFFDCVSQNSPTPPSRNAAKVVSTDASWWFRWAAPTPMPKIKLRCK